MAEFDANPYALIGVVVLMGITLVGLILLVATLLGPKKRHGPTKDATYESGMPVVHDAHRRFHIRFYVVALLFLLFDVEVVFLWPWALVYHAGVVDQRMFPLADGRAVGAGFLLIGMGLFFSILVLGLVYEWKKGAFRWD